MVHLTWLQPHLPLPALGLCSDMQPISKGLYCHAFGSGLLQADVSSSLLCQTPKAFLSLLAIPHSFRMDSFPLCPSTEHNFHRLRQFPESFEHPWLQWSTPTPPTNGSLEVKGLIYPKEPKTVHSLKTPIVNHKSRLTQNSNISGDQNSKCFNYCELCESIKCPIISLFFKKKSVFFSTI